LLVSVAEIARGDVVELDEALKVISADSLLPALTPCYLGEK
jgi:hypothetical protein